MKQLLPLALLTLSCTPAALNDAKSKAQAASDAREYACRYIEMLDSAEPRIQQAQSLCKSGAELQLVLAAAAGAEACEQVAR